MKYASLNLYFCRWSPYKTFSRYLNKSLSWSTNADVNMKVISCKHIIVTGNSASRHPRVNSYPWGAARDFSLCCDKGRDVTRRRAFTTIWIPSRRRNSDPASAEEQTSRQLSSACNSWTVILAVFFFFSVVVNESKNMLSVGAAKPSIPTKLIREVISATTTTLRFCFRHTSSECLPWSLN